MRTLLILLVSATLANAETIGEVYLTQAARIIIDKSICHKPFRYYEYNTLRDKVAAEYQVDGDRAAQMIAEKALQIVTADYCDGR